MGRDGCFTVNLSQQLESTQVLRILLVAVMSRITFTSPNLRLLLAVLTWARMHVSLLLSLLHARVK